MISSESEYNDGVDKEKHIIAPNKQLLFDQKRLSNYDSRSAYVERGHNSKDSTSVLLSRGVS